MNCIDLRSDTVTWPTPEMRQAMAQAEVGDDVWGDDPTVNRLQAMAAERLGMEAALLVTSGTMGNLAAALSHCQRGDELIMGNQSHTFRYEAGGVAALGGIHPHTLPNLADGTLDLVEVEAAVRRDDLHFPPSRAIFIENTHNICGGVVLSPDYFARLREVANRHHMRLHLDGARIFNAAAAQGRPVTDWTQYVDSVTFCLSKGLCAPVGSVLCGSADFIQRAGRVRKMLGGGMRQAGVLAAAGIVALEKMVGRLADDHMTARQLACGLAAIPGVILDLERVQTNLVFFKLSETVALEPTELIRRLDQDYHVKIGDRGGRAFRAVTHYWIDSAAVETALTGVREIVASAS